ncbi:hypothetical protein ACTXT7_007371 [Hymenolepis weldensis]
MSVTRKIKPMLSQVTESIASSMRNMKQSKNAQKNPHERVKTTSEKKGKKRKQLPELVLRQHPKRMSRTKRKENDRSYENGLRSDAKEAESCTRYLLDGCSSKTWWEISNVNTNENEERTESATLTRIRT